MSDLYDPLTNLFPPFEGKANSLHLSTSNIHTDGDNAGSITPNNAQTYHASLDTHRGPSPMATDHHHHYNNNHSPQHNPSVAWPSFLNDMYDQIMKPGILVPESSGQDWLGTLPTSSATSHARALSPATDVDWIHHYESTSKGRSLLSPRSSTGFVSELAGLPPRPPEMQGEYDPATSVFAGPGAAVSAAPSARPGATSAKDAMRELNPSPALSMGWQFPHAAVLSPSSFATSVNGAAPHLVPGDVHLASVTEEAMAEEMNEVKEEAANNNMDAVDDNNSDDNSDDKDEDEDEDEDEDGFEAEYEYEVENGQEEKKIDAGPVCAIDYLQPKSAATTRTQLQTNYPNTCFDNFDFAVFQNNESSHARIILTSTNQSWVGYEATLQFIIPEDGYVAIEPIIRTRVLPLQTIPRRRKFEAPYLAEIQVSLAEELNDVKLDTLPESLRGFMTDGCHTYMMMLLCLEAPGDEQVPDTLPFEVGDVLVPFNYSPEHLSRFVPPKPPNAGSSSAARKKRKVSPKLPPNAGSSSAASKKRKRK